MASTIFTVVDGRYYPDISCSNDFLIHKQAYGRLRAIERSANSIYSAIRKVLNIESLPVRAFELR